MADENTSINARVNHNALADILDECIDRLAAGESVEDCVARYPQHADELRGLLTTGSALSALLDEQRTPRASTEITDAQQRTHLRLVSAMEESPMFYNERPKRKRKAVSVSWLGAAAIALLMLGAGVGIGVTGANLFGMSNGTVAEPQLQPSAVTDVVFSGPTAPPLPTTIPGTIIRQQTVQPTVLPLSIVVATATPVADFRELPLAVEVGNLNSVLEYVRIRPIVPVYQDQTTFYSVVVDLTGWTISDDDGNTYTFPHVMVSGNTTDNHGVLLYSRAGVDSGQALYWNKDKDWQQDDILTIQDENGNIIIRARVSELLSD